MNLSTSSPINSRLADMKQSSTIYANQAEKFHAEATQLSSILEKSFIEAEQYINNRMQSLSSQGINTGQRLENERTLLLATRSKLDTTLAKLTQCHQEALRLQSNTDGRFRLMISTAKGRLEQVERLAFKMKRYEETLEIASPTTDNTDLMLTTSDNSTSRQFQEELRRITEQLKVVVRLGKEARSETHILHGQYDTDVHRRIAALMRHDKTEREQLSTLIEHKQTLQREIAWMREQKKNIDIYVTTMAPVLDKCLCDGTTTANNCSSRMTRR